MAENFGGTCAIVPVKAGKQALIASAPGRASLVATRWPSASSVSRSSPQRTVKDRKSTRLNSSHLGISYAVFCLKKKKTNIARITERQAEVPLPLGSLFGLDTLVVHLGP